MREERKVQAEPAKPKKESAPPEPKLNDSVLDAPSEREESIILPQEPSMGSQESQEEDLDSARPENAPLLEAPA